mmetsp:Transcript_12494/g.42515  ORF Transcript_12494/g.42515 Transcript_12494/m.42515 type:complete len:273 (+) Transcript_12494:1929-2747(+)
MTHRTSRARPGLRSAVRSETAPASEIDNLHGKAKGAEASARSATSRFAAAAAASECDAVRATRSASSAAHASDSRSRSSLWMKSRSSSRKPKANGSLRWSLSGWADARCSTPAITRSVPFISKSESQWSVSQVTSLQSELDRRRLRGDASAPLQPDTPITSIADDASRPERLKPSRVRPISSGQVAFVPRSSVRRPATTSSSSASRYASSDRTAPSPCRVVSSMGSASECALDVRQCALQSSPAIPMEDDTTALPRMNGALRTRTMAPPEQS